MFSTIQNIIGLSKPRETENADAYFNMRKRISDENARGGKKSFFFGENSSEEDKDVISVQSALLFLEGFLESRLDIAFEEERKERRTPPAMNSWLQTENSNQNAGMVAKAYEHAAEISKTVWHKADRTANSHRREELKLIYQLIQDLRDLMGKGVQELSIDSGSSFLEAIVDSVARAK